MKRLLVALLLVALSSPASARAPFRSPPKPVPTLEIGSRVRVTLLERKEAPVIGTLLALDPSALEVTAAEDTTRFSRLEVARVEISRGMHSRAGRYAGYGALLFGTLGAVSGARAGRSIDNKENSAAVVGMLGGALGALVGGGLGALVGGGIKEERWERVPLRP